MTGRPRLTKEARARLAEQTRSTFFALLKMAGVPIPEWEFQFDAVRKWRFDYCWSAAKVALEVEGGIFVQGRHSRGAGMLADMMKYNHAAMLGYRVLRVPPNLLHDLATIGLIARSLSPLP